MDDWVFLESSGRLYRPERSIQLTPKAAAVLACLARNADEIASVQQILDEVWQNVHVSPDLVREYIFDLRTALNDDARSPRFIETIRGRGFRLKARISTAAAEALPALTPEQQPARPTIAVLKPTVYGDANAVHVASAMAADIINMLARFHDIGVVARHTSFASEQAMDLRAFTRDVGADYVLEASVGILEERIRVRMQLVDGGSSRTLWAHSNDFDAHATLSAIDHTVEAVVGALTGWNGEVHRAEFAKASAKRDDNLNAYEHFILGRDLDVAFETESIARSLFHLERAVGLEPGFARAWLAYSITLRWAYDVIPERDPSYLSRAKAALATAYRLIPRDSITQALVALERARDGDIASALDLLHGAEASMGTDPDAMVCLATCTALLTDDTDRAQWLYKEGVRRNPTPPRWLKVVEARIAFLAGDYRRCIACARLGPRQFSAAIFECLSHAMLDDREQASAVHADLRTRHPDLDFAAFATQLPIANTTRRTEYDAAVARLEDMLAHW